jgi:hypothetical protein
MKVCVITAALAVTLCLAAHRGTAFPFATPRTPQPLHHVREQGIPTRYSGERLRPGCPAVTALASNRYDVLA